MTYAEKLVNQAISVLKADVGDRTLERVTPLEGEETCWFFGFPKSEAVMSLPCMSGRDLAPWKKRFFF